MILKKNNKKIAKKKNLSEKKLVKKEKNTPAKNDGEENTISTKGSVRTPALLRGMKDLLPKEEFFWKTLHHTAENLAEAYGFGLINTPILEETALFVRSLGRGTDVVDKEMYSFEDLDGGKICLRPEATASCARAFIVHGMQSLPQPVKFWYYGPMFRHDRPQAGRYRQFTQFGCESFGVHDPVVDAELIAVAYHFLEDLGLKVNVHLNSLGTPEDRQNYLIELTGYLRTKRSYLCEDCKKRLVKNPLRVLDCKNLECKEVLNEAPQIIEWLSESSKSYFMKVLEYLDEINVPYVLQNTLVRGLDYYTDTVFEIYLEEDSEGAQSALCGGGRYNGLVEQLGGRPTPGAGFSIGLERVISVLRKQTDEGTCKIKEVFPSVFFAQLGEQARRRALRLLEVLRKSGIVVAHSFGKSSLKGQMEMADKLKVRYSLILGQKEVQDGTAIIRDMESGIQEIVDQKKLKNALEKKLQPKV
ncbi:MAG: Histidine-tRNA ligase [Candidatus Magasanikbacteria bacterium GW2011_GWC2_37_14]|uniref:Histidine--tRNA ligase n=1 Tax=Candidatus Magasanikbacteria bacterium GW2011_GWC2_37_14 TaxID=1619046 RepID=A0A0G0IU28_9BACT|nr:MAG: Histidine-tRNA ligase [Candidatus Magasanikbacteria bacterium GW2011_GWC2_37_14]